MRKSNWLILLLCLLLLALLPAAALGDENEARVTVLYKEGEDALVNAQFDLYRVANMDASGKLTLTSTFARYPIRVQDLLEEIDAMSATLEGYVLRDKISPMQTKRTDAQGVVEFAWPRASFAPGVFLLLGKEHLQGGNAYQALPILFVLPYAFDEGDELNYELLIRMKVEKEPDDPNPPAVRRKALKVWMDEGYENERPQEVTVQLLCDGEIYDTQTLSSENNWSYEWTELSGEHEWSLTEKEMDGYRVSVEQAGITFVVTNTYDSEIVLPTPTPTVTPEVTPEPSTSPEVTATPKPTPTKTPKPTPTKDPSVLPQTGQLWWPVPVLLAAGLLLIVLGLMRRRGGQDEE